MNNAIDIIEDMQIYRSQNGIVLFRPDEHHDKPTWSHQNTQHTIKSILKLSCNIYFSDINNLYKLVNDPCAESCGFDSPKNALNKSLFVTSIKESAKIIYDNNNEVLNTNKIKIIEEELFLNNGYVQQGLSIKLPWYNVKDEIIGLFGITIISGKQKLDQILSHIVQTGFLNHEKSFRTLNLKYFYFSTREKEIIYWITRKKTAKEIGAQLNVSHRTIEKHIENIKTKLNVKTKADIINKIHDEQKS